jgi:hypothetical protein
VQHRHGRKAAATTSPQRAPDARPVVLRRSHPSASASHVAPPAPAMAARRPSPGCGHLEHRPEKVLEIREFVVPITPYLRSPGLIPLVSEPR